MEYSRLVKSLLFLLTALTWTVSAATGDEASLVRRIESLGGDVIHDDKRPGRPIVGVNLLWTQATDADIKELATLPHLERLLVCRGKATPACMKYLEQMQNLKELTITSLPLTDAGMKSLARLAKLERLEIWGPGWQDVRQSAVTDAGLRELAVLKNLRALDLSKGPLTPSLVTGVAFGNMPHLATSLKELALAEPTAEGLIAIAGLKNLEKLDTGRARLSAAHIKRLSGLQKMRELRFTPSETSKEAWHELRKFRSLEILDLTSWSDVGDDALESLGHLKKLKKLILGCGKITGAGLSNLAKLDDLLSLEIHFSKESLGVREPLWMPRNLQSLAIGFPWDDYGRKPADFGDAVFKEIAAAKDLSQLTMSSVPIDGARLKHLSGLRKLDKLDLGRTRETLLKALGEAGMLHLLALARGAKTADRGHTRPHNADEVLYFDLSHFDPNIEEVGDLGLKQLTRFKKLKGLYLQKSFVTDIGLQELATFKELESLQLAGTKVTLEGVKELSQLKKLKILSLRDTAVTDEGLKQLARLTDLEWLTLVDTKVTSKGIEALAGLPKLNLELDARQFTDSMLRVLRKSGLIHRLTGHPVGQLWGMHSGSINGLFDAPPVVTKLDLAGAPLTDAGVKELVGLQKLKVLNLSHTGISDAGLEYVAQFKALAVLDVTDTSLTDAAVKKLKERLPNLRITR